MKNQIEAPVQCDNWDLTLKRFDAWWENKSIGRPMMRIVAKRDTPTAPLAPIPAYTDFTDLWMNVDRKILTMQNQLKTHRFMAESYPEISFDMGAGSLAAYMGAPPTFKQDTVWFDHCLDNVSNLHGMYDPQNVWLTRQLADIQKAKEVALREGFLLGLPDIIENLDIYSSLRGAQDTCYDLIDDPEIVQQAIAEIDRQYFTCYDTFAQATCRPDGIVSTIFKLLGTGRIGKVQCDFSAMMSPTQFRSFIMPSLTQQFANMDKGMYHLDGPDALRHLDTLLEIKHLRGFQWEGGAGKAVSGSKEYYPIYDRMRQANKSLLMFLNFGTLPDWIETVDRIVDRYGNQGIYFLFQEMTEKDGEYILDYADKHWTSKE